MEKNLNYYMGLPYVVEIKPLTTEDGGGFLARIPLFGIQGIVSDGPTIEDALENLEISKEIIFSELLDKGKDIPEPTSEKDEQDYSGKILIRMPKWLHHSLSYYSEKNDSSLNSYIITLLASAMERDTSSLQYEEIITRIETMCNCVEEIKDNIDSKFSMNFSSRFPFSDEYSDAKAA